MFLKLSQDDKKSGKCSLRNTYLLFLLMIVHVDDVHVDDVHVDDVYVVDEQATIGLEKRYFLFQIKKQSCIQCCPSSAKFSTLSLRR